MATRNTRSEKLDLRLTSEDQTLADSWTFGLDAFQWKAFMDALDAPPRQLPRLARLLNEPGFFDAEPKQ